MKIDVLKPLWDISIGAGAGITFLLRTCFNEKIKNSVKHECDILLESYKSELKNAVDKNLESYKSKIKELESKNLE